eukprot:SAG31_NODE_88_length_26714_cov_6.972046_9_plen_95_part_00
MTVTPSLQAELLAELRRSVAAVEAAEHVIARPVQAEVDALERRIADIDRLGELARLKIRVEPQHRFVEYTRLLHQVPHTKFNCFVLIPARFGAV